MDTHSIINLLHILLIAPFFAYIGIVKSDIPQTIFYVLMALGIIVTLYHGYKLAVRIQAKSGLAWINAIHAFYVGPLLFYIGYKQKEAPRSAYEVLLLFAFAAGGYHLYEFAAYSSMKGGAEAKIVDMKNTSQ